MRFILLFFINLFLLTTLQAQETAEEEIVQNVYRLLSNTNSYEGVPYYALNTKTTKVVAGSAFLNEKWQEGLMMTPQDSIYRITARYNAYDDEMQMLSNGKVKVLPPSIVKGISLEGKVFLTLPYFFNKKREVGYFELLVDGKIPLLCHYKATSQQAATHPVLGSVDGEVKIVLNEHFYYSTKNKPAEKLSKSRKSFLTIFEDESKTIDQHIKKKKLSIKKKEDLVAVFTYYNELNLDH